MTNMEVFRAVASGELAASEGAKILRGNGSAATVFELQQQLATSIAIVAKLEAENDELKARANAERAWDGVNQRVSAATEAELRVVVGDNDELKAKLAASEAARAKMREAVESGLKWLRNPTANVTEEFDRVGDWFYRDTGILRPGKSYPLEMNPPDDDERDAVWKEWCFKQSHKAHAALREALAADKEAK